LYVHDYNIRNEILEYDGHRLHAGLARDTYHA